MIKREVWYFRGVGPQNTPACLELMEKAVAEGFRHLVVASTTGDSGAQAARRLQGKDVNLVVVGHSVGLRGPISTSFGRSITRRSPAWEVKCSRPPSSPTPWRRAWRTNSRAAPPPCSSPTPCGAWGRGSRCVCEIVMEAVDAGLIPEGEEVVAVGGTARGWDTVAIIKSAASKRFMQLSVLEIWGKPRV